MNDAGRVGFVVKGNYDNNTLYEFLDVVYYGSSSYVAKKATIGNVPGDDTEFWHILVSGTQSASPGTPGIVLADGTTISVSEDGVISAIVLEKDGELEEIPKLWGKDNDGNHGFSFSHINAIYYDWESRTLLGTKLSEMNVLIHSMEQVTPVTLTAAGWEGTSAPYTQTVSVNGAKEGREPIMVSALADGATLEEQKAYTKAYGIINSGTGTIGEGTATFKVYEKPETTITIGLKGAL